jgi:hypothetical protein
MSYKIILLLLLFAFSASLISSQEKEKELSHYIFPSFTRGKILLKSGGTKEVMINYNSITEEMVFEANGTKLALANPEYVDTIFISGKKFITSGAVYYEVLESFRIPLLARHLCSVIPPGKESGYGGTSETSSIKTASTMFAQGRVYEMKLPEGYRILPYMEYVLKKDNEYVRIYNLNLVIKCFPEKKNDIRAFAKTNETSFKKEEDVRKLIEFCNK